MCCEQEENMAFYRCTNCSEIFEAADDRREAFCPNCGAHQILPGAYQSDTEQADDSAQGGVQPDYTGQNAGAMNHAAQGTQDIPEQNLQNAVGGMTDANKPYDPGYYGMAVNGAANTSPQSYAQQPYQNNPQNGFGGGAQSSGYPQNTPAQRGGIAYPSRDAYAPVSEKKGMSKGLLIGLIAGGAAVLVAIIVVLVIAFGSRNGVTPVPGGTAAISQTISAGGSHTVGIMPDGTAVAAGDNLDGQCDVYGWTDIVTISAGYEHTLGVKSDGSVLAAGSDVFDQCQVSTWSNIKSVAAGTFHSLGLKNDGTVVAVGDNDDGQCNVAGWTGITAIAAGYHHSVGLRSDGTVVAVGGNDEGQCNVHSWTDIVAVAVGDDHTVGLKADGTVVATGVNYGGEIDTDAWTNITAISAGYHHTMGLRSDGTVVAVGLDSDGRCSGTSTWTDVTEIAAGGYFSVAMRSDGTLNAAGSGEEGQLDVNNWKLK